MGQVGLTTHVAAIPYGVTNGTQEDAVSVELAESTLADDTACCTMHNNA